MLTGPAELGWIERLAAHLADTDYAAHIAAGLLGIGGPDD